MLSAIWNRITARWRVPSIPHLAPQQPVDLGVTVKGHPRRRARSEREVYRDEDWCPTCKGRPEFGNHPGFCPQASERSRELSRQAGQSA